MSAYVTGAKRGRGTGAGGGAGGGGGEVGKMEEGDTGRENERVPSPSGSCIF